MVKTEAFCVRRVLPGLLSLFLLLASCSPTQPLPDEILVHLSVDGEDHQLTLPFSTTSRQALQLAGVELGLLDRTEPDLLSKLSDGESLQVIRVTEEFETQESLLPFMRRILRNESLPQGDQRLIQAGKNGLQEITFRLVFEEGNLISRTRVNTNILDEAVDEIVMLGVQAPSTALTITGRLAFLSAGNAWLIEENTGLRRLLVASGDLDGRVFSISPDGDWLLFTRENGRETSINSLWTISLNEANGVEIELGVGDVVHYAGWVPGEETSVSFSTVETSPNPPGWQANNDLQLVEIFPNESISNPSTLLSSRADSLYSWWGTDYSWSSNGELLSYASPDSVGLVDLENNQLNSLLDLLVFQTESEWAWMPTISWAPDASQLFTVNHAEQPGLDNQERSPFFDVVALDLEDDRTIRIAEKAGMFANPAASPLFVSADGEETFWLAYLQALNPTQSDVSAYQLMILGTVDKNAQALFPTLGAPGLIPQRIAWSPLPQDADSSLSIALIYQSNLWIVDAANGRAQQITGDGLVTRVAWGR